MIEKRVSDGKNLCLFAVTSIGFESGKEHGAMCEKGDYYLDSKATAVPYFLDYIEEAIN